jgi:hypothetical protein
MSNHAVRSIALADKIVSFAEDGTRSIDRAIAAWPDDFKAIIWDAVAEIAKQRAAEARANTPALCEGK